MRLQNKERVVLALRVIMGAWFVYAGGLKIFASGLDRFATDVENYKLVSGGFALAIAYFVPWLEVIGGLCFILGLCRKGALWTMFGLVLVFSLAVGSAWIRGLDISCGCLGGTEKISYWRKALEFGFYFLILGYIAVAERKSTEPTELTEERQKP
ncbi:MauE/DoxX family redox-associated membrane protein [Luteolibacter algae]|uniref:MauE/DoxX family redox-associated membrane protein n=1 Tax=Luteolibacter algae TaxID=454151 RepID=A0ABW5D479_9BACT